MSFKRYSKLLLVVLALALWASTAYGQVLTLSAPTATFSYTKGQTAPAPQSIGLTADADGLTYSAVSADTWLTGCVPGTANIAAGAICDLALDTTVADLLAPGPHPTTVTITPLGGAPVVVTVNLTMGSPLSSTDSAITLMYFRNTNSAVPQDAAIVDSDPGNDTYSVDATACGNWLTVPPSGIATGSASSALTFGVNPSNANLVGRQVFAPCNVVLSYLGIPFQTVVVSATITSTVAALSAPATPYNPTFAKNTSSASTQNLVITGDSAVPDTFTVDITACPFITVSPAGALTAGFGANKTITWGVDSTLAGAMGVGIHPPCNVLLMLGATVFQTVPVNLTITATAAPLSTTTAAVNLTYIKDGAANQGPATSSASIVGDSLLPDAYTIVNSCPSWLVLTPPAGASASFGSPSTLTFSVGQSFANLIAPGVQTSCNVVLKVATGGAIFKTVPVILTISDSATPFMTSSTPTIVLSYIKGGGASQASAKQIATISSEDTILDVYTAVPASCPPWLLVTSASTPAFKAGLGASDALTFKIDSTSAVVNGLTGTVTGNCTVSLDYAGTPFQSEAVSWTISPTTGSTSPLSLVVAGVKNLTYVRYGGVQATATLIAAINSTDTSSEAITATVTGAPAWLTAVGTTASISTPGQVTFTVVPGSAADVLTLGAQTDVTVNLVVAAQPPLAVTVHVTIVAQSLSSTSSSVSLSYTKGGTPPTKTAPIMSVFGSVPFTVDQATRPPWLTVTGTMTAITGGTTITFAGTPTVITGMAAGNYSGNVGFIATVTPLTGVAEFRIPVTLNVSAGQSTISLKEGTNADGTLKAKVAAIFTPTTGAIIPSPTVTLVSSGDTVGFTATCTAATSNPIYTPNPVTACLLKNGAATPAASMSGITSTWGTPLGMTLEPNLFMNGTPFGTVVTFTVSVTGGGAAVPNLVYEYTLAPVAAKLTVIGPTSTSVPTIIAPATVANPVVVTLQGSNYVNLGMIVPGSPMVATKVFSSAVSATLGPWTEIQTDLVVMDGSTIIVTIPASLLPAIVSPKTTASLFLGVANQLTSTPPVKPEATGATATLTVTNNPVIYAITSTATYLQPNPGSSPKVAPYELISIFGANFQATAPTIAVPDAAFSKYPTSLTVGQTGTGTAAKNIVMKVNFTTIGDKTPKVFSAPILFANATQINAMVPAGLATATANVTVSSGSASVPPASDNFLVNFVVADPGIFTLTSQGTGQGAILNMPSYSVNGPGHESTALDTISIYMTGMGTPLSIGTNAASNPVPTAPLYGYPAGCTSVASYLTAVNTAVTTVPKYTPPIPIWTNIDGALMTKLLGGTLPPCMTADAANLTTVSFAGGADQPVTYAGFVSGSVAGLYQVNVVVPAGLTTVLKGIIDVPIVVKINGVSSPAGVVTIRIKP